MGKEQIVERAHRTGRITKADILEFLTIIRTDAPEVKENKLSQLLSRCPDVDVPKGNNKATQRQYIMKNFKRWDRELNEEAS